MPIEDGKEYRKIAGIWYLHEFAEVEVNAPVFLAGLILQNDSEIQIVSKSKRQLGKKQLKELGLRNDSWNVLATVAKMHLKVRGA